MTVTPRKPGETDAEYLQSLAMGAPSAKGIVLSVTMSDGEAQDLRLATIRLSPNGGVVADRIGGMGLVLRLAPPPADDESIYGLIERVARRCREVDEFGR